MRRWKNAVWTMSLGLLAAACGGDGPTAPEPQYESIAGTYTGVMAGLTQGIALNADFSVTITQSSATLGGSWSLSGTLNDGVLVVGVQGTGTLNGTIAAGTNPSVNVVLSNACPGYSAAFSGAYDSANRLLTISGPVDVLDGCDVLLRYQGTILLSR